MNLDYYDLPFGAQLLLWTSRIIVNASCRTFPNKYKLVDIAYKKVGLEEGLSLLKELLLYLRNNKKFKLQQICTSKLILNEIEFINCIEDNKSSNFNNYYYFKLWALNNNKVEFYEAAKRLSKSFKVLNLDTNLRPVKDKNLFQNKKIINKITLH